MAAITFTTKNVAKLPGAVSRRGVVAAGVTPGQWVYLASDGVWKLVDADAAATCEGRGYVVAIGAYGALVAKAGDVADIVRSGPVNTGATGLTPGAKLHASPTAGAADETAPGAGDFVFVMGYVDSDSVAYVWPQATAPVAGS